MNLVTGYRGRFSFSMNSTMVVDSEILRWDFNPSVTACSCRCCGLLEIIFIVWYWWDSQCGGTCCWIKFSRSNFDLSWFATYYSMSCLTVVFIVVIIEGCCIKTACFIGWQLFFVSTQWLIWPRISECVFYWFLLPNLDLNDS